MNSTTHSRWITAVCLTALAGCAMDKMGDSSSDSKPSSMNPGSSMASPAPAPTPAPAPASSGMAPAGGMAAAPGSPTQASYGVVQAIDQMQRQDVGMGAVGAAAAGGSLPTDRVYRVTVQMDDGSSRLVVMDAMPSYKVGDKVRYVDGTLTAY